MNQPAPDPAQLTVGALVTARPRAVAVLQRLRIDFCCGGHRTLAEACAQRQLDPRAVLDAVEEEEIRWRSTDSRWDERPRADLVEHIIVRFHDPLRSEIPRLRAMADKVQRVHGEKDGRIAQLVRRLGWLAEELDSHIQREERVLFPALLEERGDDYAGPVDVLRHEHEEVGALLREIRQLTDDHTPPEGACGTWRSLWRGLADLEADLHEHMHLENNILFARPPKP